MKTFFNILQTIVNVKEKSYPDEPFKLMQNLTPSSEQNHIKFLINQIFFIEKNYDICNFKRHAFAKFSALNQILDNSFNLKELKELMLNFFSKAQKHYYAFLRLAHIYKLKKYQIIVNCDLSLNHLDSLNQNTFTLIENTSKYLFSLHDLISIIENAISNSPLFFSDPLWPLNPYNKQSLSISTLYNIYFKMKYSGRVISTLFHLFFLENFDIDSFSENYESHIRSHSIKKYVYNSPYNDLYASVYNMLKSNIYTKQFSIHKDFPKDVLVNIFRPFLYYYYTINYDIKGTHKIYKYKIILNKKLKHFYEFNKTFGRKYIKLITNSKKRVINKEYHFNTKHIGFNEINIHTGLAVIGLSIPINNLLNYAIDQYNDDENDDENNDENDDENDYENDYENNDENNDDNDYENNDENDDENYTDEANSIS
jgi:hypothetical protein